MGRSYNSALFARFELIRRPAVAVASTRAYRMHGIKQKLAAALHKLVPGLITGTADDDGRKRDRGKAGDHVAGCGLMTLSRCCNS
jgi:hypothetical protein